MFVRITHIYTHTQIHTHTHTHKYSYTHAHAHKHQFTDRSLFNSHRLSSGCMESTLPSLLTLTEKSFCVALPNLTSMDLRRSCFRTRPTPTPTTQMCLSCQLHHQQLHHQQLHHQPLARGKCLLHVPRPCLVRAMSCLTRLSSCRL